MPNTKSAAKAMRASARKRVYNLRVKTKMRSEVKAVRRLIDAGQGSEAAAKLKDAMSALDKAAKKHVIKKNTAARLKSRLAKAISKASK